MSKLKFGNVSVSGFKGSGIKLEASEDASDDVAHGIVCTGYSEVELNGDITIANGGLHGLHIGSDVAATVNGRLSISNNRRHGILVEPDLNSLKADLARINTALDSPSLENFRDDLGSILYEINQELERSWPNENEILSLLFAAKNFLSVVKRVMSSPELTKIYSMICRRVELARRDLNL